MHVGKLQEILLNDERMDLNGYHFCGFIRTDQPKRVFFECAKYVHVNLRLSVCFDSFIFMSTLIFEASYLFESNFDMKVCYTRCGQCACNECF